MGSYPLVSIVTPVYNEAEHLAECIESVLSQGYENWDYTIVDNCSSDGSVEIARRYAAKDRRIRIVQNQQFLAAIPNHNLAVGQMSPDSKYCKVLLGDDWIFPDCLARMVALAEEYPSIGVVGTYGLQDSRIICSGLPYSTRPFSGREICRKHLLNQIYVFGSATSLLYRADLVRRQGRLFNEANIHADTEACFALLRNSDFGFVHQVLTFTRVRPRSLTTISNDYHTELAGMLQLLVAHGPHYLSGEEYRRCIKRHLQEYYRLLAVSWLRVRRDPVFWTYHKSKLQEAGVGFSPARLAVAIGKVIVDAAANPKQTISKFHDRRRVPDIQSDLCGELQVRQIP
jgi:glycosyltransferase involved in cell wall biosynthesis